MSSRSFLVVLLVLLPPIAHPDHRLSAQPAPLDVYHAIVEQYRLGRIEAAAKLLREAGSDAIGQAIADLARDLERGRESPWPSIDIQGAVMFHTEAVLSGMAALPSEQAWHLQAAKRLVELRAPGSRRPLPEVFVRSWLLLMVWRAQGMLELDEASEWLGHVTRRFAPDGETLLTAGSLEETRAWPKLAASLPRAPLQATLPAPGRGSLLKTAESFYRRALRLDPRLAEARLRLGWVLHQRGHYAEALEDLRRVIDAPGDQWVPYLARLFAGASCEGMLKADEAAEYYRAAISIRPETQTPRIALAFAVWSTASNASGWESARAHLLALRDPTGDATDPWWQYEFGQSWRVPAAFQEMRGEVAR